MVNAILSVFSLILILSVHIMYTPLPYTLNVDCYCLNSKQFTNVIVDKVILYLIHNQYLFLPSTLSFLSTVFFSVLYLIYISQCNCFIVWTKYLLCKGRKGAIILQELYPKEFLIKDYEYWTDCVLFIILLTNPRGA